MQPAHPGARRPALLATLVAIGVTILTACGPATPSSSPAHLESATGLSGSPSPTTRQSEPPSPTAGASPAWAVARAATLPTRLSTGLSRSVAIVVSNGIDIFGGFSSTGSTTGEILLFDPVAANIGAVGELAVPVHDAAGVLLHGAVIIFGGGSGFPSSVVQRVDANAVARVIGDLPTARADLSAVPIGGSAIVLGGAASGALPPEVLATEDGVHFRVVATLGVAVRYAAVAESGGRIYVIGGEGGAGEVSEIQRINLATGEVEVIGRMPSPISHASAMVIDGRIFVLGGRSGGIAQDAIWQVDAVTAASRLVGRLPQPASDFPLAVVGRVGYSIGGETDTQVASIVAIEIAYR